MSKTCGKRELSSKVFNRLTLLGEALDQELQLSVFDGGLVGFDHEKESEVIRYVAQRQAQRSATGSRSRRRTSSEPWWGQAGEADHFRSEAHEIAFGNELRVLTQHYAALKFEEPEGLWVAVSSSPLGASGPQAHFLIGVPFDRRIEPRAWAFEKIGVNVRRTSQKHTNFPDGSICAFVKEDSAWSPDEGLIGLVDHYSVWMIKKWHRDYAGFWPGPQAGACAIYRRLEFLPEEWCGCGSGRRYNLCHQALDLLVDEKAGQSEFRDLFQCNYEDRKIPKQIVKAARSRWMKLPSLREVFALRPIRLSYGT